VAPVGKLPCVQRVSGTTFPDSRVEYHDLSRRTPRKARRGQGGKNSVSISQDSRVHPQMCNRAGDRIAVEASEALQCGGRELDAGGRPRVSYVVAQENPRNPSPGFPRSYVTHV